MTGITLYTHPDGYGEIFVGDGAITVCVESGVAVTLPIGPQGLAELGAALLEHATTEEQDASERAGNALGSDLVQALFEMRRHPNQEVAFFAVHKALSALVKTEHPDSAAGGFAAAIVNVLELGVANLPKHEGADQ